MWRARLHKWDTRLGLEPITSRSSVRAPSHWAILPQTYSRDTHKLISILATYQLPNRYQLPVTDSKSSPQAQTLHRLELRNSDLDLSEVEGARDHIPNYSNHAQPGTQGYADTRSHPDNASADIQADISTNGWGAKSIGLSYSDFNNLICCNSDFWIVRDCGLQTKWAARNAVGSPEELTAQTHKYPTM